MNDELAVLFAKRFIQRRDVKSVQLAFPDKVIYTPDRELRDPRDRNRFDPGVHGPLGFIMPHLMAHLERRATYGHYLLDDQSYCRLFAFDLDLKTEGFYLPHEAQFNVAEADWDSACVAFNPREAWLDRAHPSRWWTKMQMGALANKFVGAIQRELNIPCAAAYSGGKGIHVYGFTGPMPAADARDAALIVVESLDEWELERGNSQFKHRVANPIMGYPNWSLEVFPKQDSLDGKDLGNLMRLPLGRNMKAPNDPTFFMDLTGPVGDLRPHPDPVRLLTNGDPYE